MKVIDIERKGNVLRIYFGKDDLKFWYGDDWNDYPYEDNAGIVYKEFIIAYIDAYIPFNWDIVEACNYLGNEDYYFKKEYCKNDFRDGIIPFLYLVPTNELYGVTFLTQQRLQKSNKTQHICFTDTLDKVQEAIRKTGGFTEHTQWRTKND